MRKLISIIFLFIIVPSGRLHAGLPVKAIPEYDLSVSFDIPASRITGLAVVELEPGESIHFDSTGLSLLKVTLNDRDLERAVGESGLTIKTNDRAVLKIMYEAVFKDSGSSLVRGNGASWNVIDGKRISLTGNWYPRMDRPGLYRLRASLPVGYEALSEAEQIDRVPKGAGTEFLFHFNHPVDAVSLVAAREYRIFRDRVNGIDLYAYFPERDKVPAKNYLRQAKKYLEMYEKLLRKYPYGRFSVAKGFQPGSYSRPSFALLGSDSTRLPLPETFLGREVLYQWFGGSVYIERTGGNWAEGLVTYLADHEYEEQAGRGPGYRKQLLLDYHASVRARNEIALREFRGGNDPSSKAIGRGKGAMVFHMLRKSLGDEAFYGALREFIAQRQYLPASWDDIKAAFEKQSGRDLARFFSQWVDRKGLPELAADKGSVRQKSDVFDVGFELQQKGDPYQIEIPVSISLMQGGTRTETVTLDAGKKELHLSVDAEPRNIVIDGEYDLARKLTGPEIRPILAAFLHEVNPLIVLPASNREAYQLVLEELKNRGGLVKEAEDLKDNDIKTSSLALLGQDNPVMQRLFGEAEEPTAGFDIIVRKNPWNADKVVVSIMSRTPAEAESALSAVFRSGPFSILSFDQGRMVLQKTEEAQRGIMMELRQPARAIDVSLLKPLEAVIETAAANKIVYVGEYHDQHAHHAVQLQVIKGLYERGPRLAVGMEMFQRPFQKAVDDYVSGEIDERAFLRGTEYFKRWGFDYNLYKPILDFARSRKIPVVALNQKREITEKVAKTGLDSLTDEERKQVPRQMDFSDDEYRRRLKSVFDRHKGSDEKNFDFFYQAQVLWDETMALSIDEFMRKNPDYRMVIIAGGGHLAYGSGIPKRSFRRNGLPYFIVLNDGDADSDIADYIVLPDTLEGTAAPKLMAALRAEKTGVTVIGLPDESVSAKAGIKVGDRILALDNEPVESVEDIKLLLFYKQQGDALNVRVLRKRTFLSDREMEFIVQL